MKGIYLLADYPERETFLTCVKIVKECGFDFIEVGFPYSDPVADGETIRVAMGEVLKKGFSVKEFVKNGFPLVESEAFSMKIYIMTYSNVLYKLGVEVFNSFEMLSGLIIADLPNKMHPFFKEKGLKKPLIPFVTPESGEKHLSYLANCKSGFVYFIGVKGITGTKAEYSSSYLKFHVEKIKKFSALPVVVGFGIRDKKTATVALQSADGYVVGTEAVKRQKHPEELRKFLLSLPK